MKIIDFLRECFCIHDYSEFETGSYKHNDMTVSKIKEVCLKCGKIRKIKV